MNKQERYIEYIVEDLVKKTEIGDREVTINILSGSYGYVRYTKTFFMSDDIVTYLHHDFGSYIKNTYGTTDNEIFLILVEFVNEIQLIMW